jgi:hypothetical protein
MMAGPKSINHAGALADARHCVSSHTDALLRWQDAREEELDQATPAADRAAAATRAAAAALSMAAVRLAHVRALLPHCCDGAAEVAARLGLALPVDLAERLQAKWRDASEAAAVKAAAHHLGYARRGSAAAMALLQAWLPPVLRTRLQQAARRGRKPTPTDVVKYVIKAYLEKERAFEPTSLPQMSVMLGKRATKVRRRGREGRGGGPRRGPWL